MFRNSAHVWFCVVGVVFRSRTRARSCSSPTYNYDACALFIAYARERGGGHNTNDVFMMVYCRTRAAPRKTKKCAFGACIRCLLREHESEHECDMKYRKEYEKCAADDACYSSRSVWTCGGWFYRQMQIYASLSLAGSKVYAAPGTLLHTQTEYATLMAYVPHSPI